MVKLGRPGLPETERRRVWELWKQGHSFTEISETVGAPPGSVFSNLRPRGGIWFPEPTPPPGALSLAEREAISRGLAADKSLRTIAAELGRAPSTISREITKNTGPTKYRALLQRLAAVRGRLSLCADQAAAAKWWLSMPMASVSAEGPMPKALSTRRTSPLMPGCRHQGRACPLRRARMTSNPLIVA